MESGQTKDICMIRTTYCFNALKVLEGLLLLLFFSNGVLSYSRQACGNTLFVTLPIFMITKTGGIVGNVDFAVVTPLLALAHPVLYTENRPKMSL
jgi:hypothetical protein